MNSQGSSFPHRRALMLRVQPLLIKAMTYLVQDSEEPVVEIVRAVTSRNPAIARADRAEKGVRSGIQPATLEIETDRGSHRLAEEPLLFDGEFTVQERPVWLALGMRKRSSERHQFLSEGIEERCQRSMTRAGLVL